MTKTIKKRPGRPRKNWVDIITKDPEMIKQMKTQTKECCQMAVEQDGLLLEHCQIRNVKIVKEAILNNPEAFRFLKGYEQTQEMALLAVQRKASLLAFVKQQTEEICIIAVRKNANLLAIVKRQTPAICAAAITNDASALKHVQKKTLKLCFQAARKNKKSISYIDNQFFKFLVSILTR